MQSIVFKEHEGSFLVGMAAAMASKTGKVGFVGGMDIPLIRKFALGYEEGAKYVNPKIEIFQNMTGTTPAAWNDPTRGGELARSQFDRGADVVYAAAGATGLGVLQAAKDKGRLAIGVDSNQNHLHPGTILTSMIKRVDLAVYEAFKTAKDGTWKAGVRNLGVAESGVGYSVDEHNRKLITPGDGEAARAGARRHRGRQDQGHRLHGEVAQGHVRPRGPRDPPRRCHTPRPGAADSVTAPPVIELRGIDKWFGEVHANQDSRSRSAPARSTASSARTAPASRP